MRCSFPLGAIAAAALLAGPAFAQVWPVPPAPAQNPTTPEKVVLGKILFWDEQLSSDDTMACGSCHIPEFGGGEPHATGTLHPGPDKVFGTADDIHGSPGVWRQDSNGAFAHDPTFGLSRQVTARQSPTNLGAAFHTRLFVDGRATGTFVDPETGLVALAYGGALESQAIGPILSDREMSAEGRTWQDVREKLQRVTPLVLATGLTADIQLALQQDPSYPELFENAFGDPAITAVRIAFALASYQRTLIPDDSPWDRFTNGQTTALTPAQQHGWTLFRTTARCNLCHIEPFFSDDLFHNLGLRPKAEDPGRGAILGVPSEEGAFKTPTLRNTGLRHRQFHNGQSPALLDPAQVTDPASVLNVYLDGGGVERTNLDPYMTVLSQQGITVTDMLDVLDFVANGLTDPRAAQGLPPFDHPQLRALTLPPPPVFGQGLAGAIEPFLIDCVPLFPGNPAFRLGIAAGDGPTLAVLGYGLAPIQPTLWAGLPWNVDVQAFDVVPLAGPVGSPGLGTLRFAVPADPALAGLTLYLQAFAQDPLAAGGVGASKGWEFVVR